MEAAPFISICIPAYQRTAFLKRLLDSIKIQTYSNYEVVITDDSPDFDVKELVEKVIGSNEYVLSGRLEIDYLNEKYQLSLPEKDDYETLAGMILFYYGSIPGNNDIIRIGNILIKVLRATTTRLELVNLKIE